MHMIESNGTMERAVQAIGGSVRTLKVATEQSCNISIGPDSPAFLWMIEYAPAVLDPLRYRRQHAVRTTSGKTFPDETPEFGGVGLQPTTQTIGVKARQVRPKVSRRGSIWESVKVREASRNLRGYRPNERHPPEAAQPKVWSGTLGR